MRRILGLLAVIGLVAAISPPTVAAATPFKVTESETRLLCDLPSEDGFVTIFVSIGSSDAFGGVAIWKPDADLPFVISSWGSASYDATILEGNFDLVLFDDPEKGAGQARLHATLTPEGAEQVITDRVVRDGNRRYTIHQAIQQLTAAGSLTLSMYDGSTERLDLATCSAGTMTSSYFSTNPSAYMTNTEQVFVSCEWQSELGVIDLLAIADDFMSFSAISIVGTERALTAPAVPDVLTADAFGATFELVDPMTGESAGTAVAAAGLSPSGERITDLDWMDPYRFNVVGEALTVGGELTVSVDGQTLVLPMDEKSCDAGDVKVQVMEKIPRG